MSFTHMLSLAPFLCKKCPRHVEDGRNVSFLGQHSESGRTHLLSWLWPYGPVR